MPHTNKNDVTDAELIDARDNWRAPEWDAHFSSLGVMPASGARYEPSGGNDVLRLALLQAQQGKCWLQGSASCRSRALLLREAEIDHIVAQTAPVQELRNALNESSFQQGLFDVHDPGNLAIACHACNNEKRRWSILHFKRLADIEQQRAKVIRAWHKWHSDAEIDESALTALQGAGLEDEATQEMYAEVVASMILKLAQQAGQPNSMNNLKDVVVEMGPYALTVGPSRESIEAYAEMLAEMEADDRRHGI